ncbi:MAG: SoxR reducing system RseC family protein [Clostridia bacterium]|nr:SoxR reducing system RseC family protein [Clostridia bacterium]
MGEITAVHGDLLEVTFCHQKDCGSCHACENGQRQSSITVAGKGNVGDFAAIEMPGSTVVKASLLAYVIPMACFMLGLWLGRMWYPADPNLGSAIFGMLFLLLSFGTIALFEKRRRRSAAWQPQLTRVIPRDLRDAGQVTDHA